MELFIVNRYDPGGEQKLSSNEEKLRQDLLKKIEDRKRRHSESAEVVQQSITPDNAENELGQPKKKRKRKKKSVQQEEAHEEEFEEAKPANFLVIGKDSRDSQKKVKRVLPNWLKNAEVVSVDLKNLEHTVDSLKNLDSKLIEKLKSNGITHFFPVQAQVIPCLLSTLGWPSMFWPRDICVSAPTGSGKTLAFVLPILQALKNRLVVRVRALVVLPVQDLAKQVFRVFQTYSSATTLKVILLSSAMSLSQEQKHLVKKDDDTGYRSLVDIVITTPGRLVDHLKATEGFTLKELRYLVIDEADRVMEGVQNDWLYHLNVHMGLHTGATKSFQLQPLCLKTFREHERPPQKLLFSATLSQDPEKLQALGLFNPKLFTSVVKPGKPVEDLEEPEDEFVGKFTTPAELKEMFVIVSPSTKPLALFHLLKEKAWRQVLCFVKSREAARRLTVLLKVFGVGLFKVAIITGTLPALKRDRRIKKFAKGQLDILVCSDSMARGMDIPNVQCVISYDMPKFIKNHVHRVGRTGRAGREGIAVTFVQEKELNHFKKMMETGKKSAVEEITINDSAFEEYMSKFESALKAVKKKLEIAAALKKQKQKGKKRQNKIKKGVKNVDK